jgi:acyl transferase domain-containing protein
MTTGTEADAPAVAIVGMSGRWPGAADLAQLWRQLRAGTCAISDFEEAELLAAGEDPAEVRHPSYVPSRGLLADAERFEAPLFGFNQAEAAVLDPQHRLLLETAWSALEDAGYDPRRAPGRTGVYVGGGNTEHALAAQLDRRLATDFSPMQLRVLTDREFLAPWLSYKLDLDGPSMTVQTACSTSLAAVHVAVQALLLGECDAALAGGVSVDSVRKRGYRYQEGGILSADGRCRPFDEKAAGTVPGSGVALVVLRRLEDALADGDPIRAVIRGSAVTNDAAARVGFTAPGVDKQTAAIVEAWATAGFHPAEAQYLETHGTGTSLGDRIELAAITAALAEAPGAPAGPAGGPGGRVRRAAIGSIKSNLGHLDAAAGVSGLIKVVLMLENRCLAPTANVTRPRPELEAEDCPVGLVTEAQPWNRPDSGGPRRAGVTSVGIGGTNVHVVLEEAPEPARLPATGGHWQLLPVSARTEAQVGTAAARLAALLESPDAPALADVALTLQTGRAQLPARGYVLARTAAEAVHALRALAAAPTRSQGSNGAPEDLQRLANAWAGGASVTWPAPVPGARRAHVPTYPFAGERFRALSLAPTAAEAPRPQDEPTAGAPETGTEEAVTRLFMESMGLAGEADLDLTYFGAGGDSLGAIHLLDRLEEEHGLEVPLELFLGKLTLRELIQAVLAPADGRGGESLLDSLLDEMEAES